LTAHDPLAAVPVIPPGVESADAPGGLVLCRTPPAAGVLSFLERRFGWTRTRTFELDRAGAAFFRAIDGTRSLREIAQRLARELGLDPTEGRSRVLAFTKELMARGLIALRLNP